LTFNNRDLEKVIQTGTIQKLECGFPSPSIVTMVISLTVNEIVIVFDLENCVRGCSRSLKTAPFDRSHTTFYWSAIVNIALSCTVFALFDVR